MCYIIDRGKAIQAALPQLMFTSYDLSLPKRWIGRTLKELAVRRTYGVNVAGVKEGNQVEITPDPDMRLKEGMILMLIGSNEALEKI